MRLREANIFLDCLFMLASIALTGAGLAEESVRNQQQLADKVTSYWAAQIKGDYKAAFAMYSPQARSMVSYKDWLQSHGVTDDALGTSEYRLVSADIESIDCADDPNFSHLCEVFVRLLIESQDGVKEFGSVSNLWEIDEGVWYPSLPMAVAH